MEMLVTSLGAVRSSRRALSVGLLAAAAVLLPGCGGGKSRPGVVVNRPDWAFEDYQRLAVLPGRSTSLEGAKFAAELAEQLESRLAGSGAFEVLSRAQLQDVFAEQDLSRLADDIDAGTALPEPKVRIAQAIVTIRLTNFRLIREVNETRRPVYGRDPRGRRLVDRFGRPVIVGEERVPVYRHGAEATASMRVIDPATSQILMSETVVAEPRLEESTGQPPDESPEEMASQAVRGIADRFFRRIAPTRVRVEFDKDMLVVATDYFDGRYAEVKRLEPGATGDLVLAVRGLPRECVDNAFAVGLSAVGGRENLFQQEFVWRAGVGREGLSWRVPMSALTASGATQFVAKLYAAGDPEPRLTKPFGFRD